MKNSLLVPVVFLVHTLIWICLIAFSSVLVSYDSLYALSGRNFQPFLTSLLWHGLYYLPLAFILAFINVFVYLMRHKALWFVSLPLVLLIAGAVVVFAIPASWRVQAMFDASYSGARASMSDELKQVYTPGYIRPLTSDLRIVWFDRSSEAGHVSPVIRADSGLTASGNALSVYRGAKYDPVSRSLIGDSAAYGATGTESGVVAADISGQDPLDTEHTEMPSFVSLGMGEIRFVLDAFRSSRESGLILYYLVVGSFFVAVCALYPLRKATGWRLLNASLIVFLIMSLFAGFRYTVSGPAFEIARRFLPSAIASPLIGPSFYLCFAVLLTLVSLIVFVARKLHRKAAEAFR